MARPQHADTASTNSDGACGDVVRGALARYLEDLASQPLAPRTREAYGAHVTSYVAWLAGRPAAEAALREPGREIMRHATSSAS